MNKVEILDSTLREGEQTAGVSFSLKQKIEIATLLDEFGIGIIEAGHPVVSPDIFNAVKTIASQDFNAEILAHSRALKQDIDVVLDCDADWVGIFFSVSDRSLEQRFRTDIGGAISIITEAISYAKDHGLKVRYTPEDTVRSEFSKVVQVSKAAVDAVADRISVADTVGIMTPSRMYDFISRLRKEVHATINIHCHNDLGMAVANSIAAYEAGARLIDVCVNGLGERTGISSLAETCVALKVLHNVKNNWNLEILPQLSELVEKYSRIKISSMSPIVGKNAFSHNAGLHVSAVFLDPKHYESIPVQLIGKKRKFILSKFASKKTVDIILKEHGLSLDEGHKGELLELIKLNGGLTEERFLKEVHKWKQ